MNPEDFIELLNYLKEDYPDMSPAGRVEVTQIMMEKEKEESYPEIPYDWEELSKL